MNLKVSQEELDTLTLKPETLEIAANLVKINGYVIIESVVPQAKVTELFTAFKKAMDWFIEKHGHDVYLKKKGFNEGTNHLGIFLPFEAPFNDSLVIEHPFAMAIIDKVLGPEYSVTLFSSNTSLPGGQKTQPVHADYGARFGDQCQVSLPITDLVFNIPLVDVHDGNGPMEIWPGGTHLMPDSWYGPNAPKPEDLAPYMHSMKVHMPAGSILIRDVRMWHRGTPNKGNEIRPNIALIYSSVDRDNRVQIPQETYDNMSPRAQRLFRWQKIGFPAIEPTHE
ncbi:phytanoyl-CoA dioxygenase family protein [Paenibacillus sp. OV219]|uniref:phytanoyl-CoA dioxygenase family protein n=1 Tax=Paenibacillus sp. OV219 TaxID=1884377 RepID=UPI0008C63949|nr:phytanoyl-CoA dioxygenase family protein [Paenibacillus sp. OV219]SEO94441.1 Ectoine hydroxylase-related dioxygenase, phytanoyl-CoA dioxygenase (PhyH) family [Paenibacillus sp. OV219]